MRYVKARLDKEDEDEAYRIYVSAALKAIMEGARYDLPWYHDLVHNRNKKTHDETDAEIIERIKNGVNRL